MMNMKSLHVNVRWIDIYNVDNENGIQSKVNYCYTNNYSDIIKIMSNKLKESYIGITKTFQT